MLEVYREMSVGMPIDITEDLVKSVAPELSGSTGSGDTDSEYLQGWLLRFRKHSKKRSISVKYFVEWIANRIPPWSAYLEFMSGHTIELDNLPGVHLVGFGETWNQCFAKCKLKFTGSEATHTCKDVHYTQW